MRIRIYQANCHLNLWLADWDFSFYWARQNLWPTGVNSLADFDEARLLHPLFCFLFFLFLANLMRYGHFFFILMRPLNSSMNFINKPKIFLLIKANIHAYNKERYTCIATIHFNVPLRAYQSNIYSVGCHYNELHWAGWSTSIA